MAEHPGAQGRVIGSGAWFRRSFSLAFPTFRVSFDERALSFWVARCRQRSNRASGWRAIMLDDEFPHAACHYDVVEERMLEFEERHSTPVNDEDRREIMMGVEADFEDCECDCCIAV